LKYHRSQKIENFDAVNSANDRTVYFEKLAGYDVIICREGLGQKCYEIRSDDL